MLFSCSTLKVAEILSQRILYMFGNVPLLGSSSGCTYFENGHMAGNKPMYFVICSNFAQMSRASRIINLQMKLFYLYLHVYKKLYMVSRHYIDATCHNLNCLANSFRLKDHILDGTNNPILIFPEGRFLQYEHL